MMKKSACVVFNQSNGKEIVVYSQLSFRSIVAAPSTNQWLLIGPTHIYMLIL